MKFWKQLCCLGLAAVAMLSVAGCGGSSSGSSGSGKMQKLSIGLMPDTDSLPFLIAEETVSYTHLTLPTILLV